MFDCIEQFINWETIAFLHGMYMRINCRASSSFTRFTKTIRVEVITYFVGFNVTFTIQLFGKKIYPRDFVGRVASLETLRLTSLS